MLLWKEADLYRMLMGLPAVWHGNYMVVGGE